jgi:hypothetical protein
MYVLYLLSLPMFEYQGVKYSEMNIFSLIDIKDAKAVKSISKADSWFIYLIIAQ